MKWGDNMKCSICGKEIPTEQKPHRTSAGILCGQCYDGRIRQNDIGDVLMCMECGRPIAEKDTYALDKEDRVECLRCFEEHADKAPHGVSGLLQVCAALSALIFLIVGGVSNLLLFYIPIAFVSAAVFLGFAKIVRAAETYLYEHEERE